MEKRKKISIMIPCYNEEQNVERMSLALKELFLTSLSNYDYEILFIDNKSTDKTREVLRALCADDKNIKAIFNVRNFGQANSPFHAFKQTTGDCTVCICADFQEPVEMIPVFVKEWEAGKKVVLAVKNHSKEGKIKYLLRTVYYKTIKRFSEVDQIEHFTGFGLYDRAFVDIIRNIHEPLPFFKGLVAEYRFDYTEVPYTQELRKYGKSKNNWYTLFDMAMLSFTSYTKVGLRVSTFIGVLGVIFSLFMIIFALIRKFAYWESMAMGITPLTIGLFFVISIQFIILGIIGEYILTINMRITDRPLVVEEERINFDDLEKQNEKN